MEVLQKAAEILEQAERALADLASDAARHRDYDLAGNLIELAREINVLKSLSRLRVAGSPAEQQPAQPVGGRSQPSESASSPSRTRGKKGRYPKFLREGESLVKIGWSRKDKSEYEHRSPRKVVTILGSALTQVAKNGKRFKMQQVLPLTDSVEGTRVPDYQTYLCLAWFRGLGFLVQHGRQGYSLASRAPIVRLIETHWARLPSR